MHSRSFREYFSSRRAFIQHHLYGNKNSAGFTIIELLIFSAIFTILMISFISILVTVTAINSRQAGAAEVNQQSQFLLQQIQYYIERASMIELNPDVATTTLKLRMAASAEDPTYIYLSGGTLYLKQTDAGAAQPLTSSKVIVSNVSFTKRQNAPSHDSVSISFVVAFNTQNLKQRFSSALQTSVARVSAATFDSNVIPSSTATYNLGLSSQAWNSINGLIYFSGTNVGVGVSSPNSKFQVRGGDVYVDTANSGLVLKAPNGTSCYRVTITNGGALATSSISCP
ncbi:MAG: prepilin-type N-terminal cleavage/methylation domain-containing protein [Patescibacteria group bacterium]